MNAVSAGSSPTSSGLRPFRLAILNSHPVQYFAPLYRRIAADPQIDLTVFFCSVQGAEEYIDEGFGIAVHWDTPLLEGYRWKLLRTLPGTSTPSAVRGFWSLNNPSILNEIWRGRYDAIWVHGHGYATHLLAIFFGRLLGSQVLMRSETHLLLSRSRLKSLLRGAVLRFMYNVLCSYCLPIGTRNWDFYRAHGVPNKKMSLVPYAVDNDYFLRETERRRRDAVELRRSLNLDDADKVVLYSSKLTARKRPFDLLRAYALLREQRSDTALWFVGSGEEQANLQRYVSDHHIPNVYFAGFRNQSELPLFYAAADVFVLPSKDEPWGLVVNEVMCAGLPVIVSSEVGAVPDLVEDGVNGLLFESGDVPTLAARLATLIGDDELRAAMGAHSREIVGRWDFERCVSGVHEALGRLDKAGSRRPRHQ